jgi:NADH-ubiquinone oxidoreductase chain 4
MSLYGIVEKFPLLGLFACSSIILSAAYTIYMFNRISLGGFFTKVLEQNVYDVNKKEFLLILSLVVLTIVLGIYPILILNTLDYSVANLIFRI